MKRSRIVPEFSTRKRIHRAGFIEGRDTEVETWQVWCRNAENPDDGRRATFVDMRKAGFVRNRRPKGAR